MDVAIIGLGTNRSSRTLAPRSNTYFPSGAFGLVALKNLKEVGCNVTGFEKNDYVGGVWKYTESPQTSVLES